METWRAIAGVLLPWIMGYACLRALPGRRTRSAFVDWGYGHFLGILVLTLLMRAVGLAGLPLALRTLVPALLLVTAAAAVVAYVRSRRPAVDTTGDAPDEGAPAAWRVLVAVAGALLALRVATIAVDVVLRPLFPWDAWTQWGTKARVWSGLHAYVPFVAWDTWLTRAPGYTDAAPHYPATVPLLQTWMALSIGRFHDALINLPWIAGFVALGLAMYGQLRGIGMTRGWSLVAVYAVSSLPLLDTHVALAGYADFHLAASFALALLALMCWERRSEPGQLTLLAIATVLLPLLKVPGSAWAAIVVLGALVARFGASWRRMLAIGGAAAAAAVVLAATAWREKLAGVLGTAQTDIFGALFDNLFLFDNWHLLWFALPLVAAVAWREALRDHRGTCAALAGGAAFLLVIFAGTRAGSWVADYTTVNRALLHIAPAAALFCAAVLWTWARGRDHRSPSADGTAPSPRVAAGDTPAAECRALPAAGAPG
jgi:hypothetical protein